MSKLDSQIPKNLNEVIELLHRRIEVHTQWRDSLLRGDEKTIESVKFGTGTIESHNTYIKQYEAAIKILINKPECNLCGGTGWQKYTVEELNKSYTSCWRCPNGCVDIIS